MKCILGLMLLLLAGCTSFNGNGHEPPAPPTPPSVQYLALLQDRIRETGQQMPAITASAEQAARRVVAGRRIYAAGARADFPKELIARGGGLLGIAPPPKLLDRGDVVLYGALSRITVNDQIKITRWRQQGVYVIVFASKALSNNPYFPPDALIDSGATEGLPLADGTLCPTDSTVNIINAWTWTGEFVAACTRLGKMPVLYESYGTNGGHLRNARYRGQMFHKDVTIAPIAPGMLGGIYLEEIDRCLEQIKQESAPARLAQAGEWVRSAGAKFTALLVESHTFPEHFQDSRAPRPFEALSFPQRAAPPKYPPLVILLGYQNPSQLVIDAAYIYRDKLIYTSVNRAQDDRGGNILYINPHWPIEDACVHVRGYDIRILPASAVAQSAIYWSIIAESVGIAPKKDD